MTAVESPYVRLAGARYERGARRRQTVRWYRAMVVRLGAAATAHESTRLRALARECAETARSLSNRRDSLAAMAAVLGVGRG